MAAQNIAEEWVLMLAGNAEFVSNYNRLCGTHLRFTPRSPIEAMVDQACGHNPVNDEKEQNAFFRHCMDLLARIALHDDEVGAAFCAFLKSQLFDLPKRAH